jgi:quinol monooxygenase YgiN
MPTVGRIVKLTAREGQGEALAEAMLRAAVGLERTPGCEQYVINRSVSEPDVIWITERWLDQNALDGSLEALNTEAGKAQVAEVMALVASSERVDVEPLGGVGYLGGGQGATIMNLDDVEDQAPKFGLGDQGEARFANRDPARRAPESVISASGRESGSRSVTATITPRRSTSCWPAAGGSSSTTRSARCARSTRSGSHRNRLVPSRLVPMASSFSSSDRRIPET